MSTGDTRRKAEEALEIEAAQALADKFPGFSKLELLPTIAEIVIAFKAGYIAKGEKESSARREDAETIAALKAELDEHKHWIDLVSLGFGFPIVEDRKQVTVTFIAAYQRLQAERQYWARQILKVRDAIALDDYQEAYHQLYAIASPQFDSTEPWQCLESIAAALSSFKSETEASGDGATKTDE